MSIEMLMKILKFQHYPRYFRGLHLRLSMRNIRRRITRLGVISPSSVVYYGMPIISLEKGSKIEIGDNGVICSDPEMTALGVNHPVVLRTLQSGASIMIGRDTGISGGSICAAVSVKIGSECLIGANVIIADTDFHAINPDGRRFNVNSADIGAEPVEIEDNVFVGTGAIILKGVKVGRNSVIGAGSVVTSDVPPDSIVAGNPARVLRRI